MIVIKKASQDDDVWATYEVFHDEECISSFRHKRGDGLALCLEKAAFAVEEEQLYIGKRLLLENS